MAAPEETRLANRRLTRRLLVVALAMFGFGFLLSPMYDVLCKVTGIGGKTGRTDQQAVATGVVDLNRTVTVEFTGNAVTGLPWEFRPLVKKLEVHPGETMEVSYYVRNTATEAVTGQAVPTVTPFNSSTHFKKIECFCFSQQTLKAGEAREMPVRFVVDADLPKDVHTVTLSYAFFNTDKTSAQRYGGEAVAAGMDHSAHHAPVPSGAGG